MRVARNKTVYAGGEEQKLGALATKMLILY